MERLVLTARVEEENGRFMARVDGLDVQAEGDSANVAREELVQAMISWISARDCTDSMAMSLAEAGFPEIDEETELHLEFADSAGPPGPGPESGIPMTAGNSAGELRDDG